MAKLLDFLLCDDIRFEQQNKLTLVGVYTDGIVLGVMDPDLPAALHRIGIFARIVLDGLTPDAFELRCFVGSKKFAELKGSLSIGNPERPIALAINTGPLVLEMGSVVLNFEVSLLKGDAQLETLKPDGVPVTVGLAPSKPIAPH